MILTMTNILLIDDMQQCMLMNIHVRFWKKEQDLVDDGSLVKVLADDNMNNIIAMATSTWIGPL